MRFILLMTIMISNLAIAAEKASYLEYLKIKAKIHKRNIQNQKATKFAPQKVLFDEKTGTIIHANLDVAKFSVENEQDDLDLTVLEIDELEELNKI